MKSRKKKKKKKSGTNFKKPKEQFTVQNIGA